MLRLQNQLISALRSTSPLPASSFHRLLLLSTATHTQFVAEDYLVASCGLTAPQARRASGYISHLRTRAKPDAVLSFLADLGLSKAATAAAIYRHPRLLRYKVDKTLIPRVSRLREIGLSPLEISRLITIFPSILVNPLGISRLEFYLSFLGSYDKVHNVLTFNAYLLGYDVRNVEPNMALLQQRGLSSSHAVKLLLIRSRSMILLMDPGRVKEIVACVDKLGVPCSSAMFKHALTTVTTVGTARVSAKLDFLKKILRCSEAELRIVMTKMPAVLAISEDRLSSKAEFLKMVVGLETEYIVQRPALLCYSMESRLIPRHYVIKVLKAKELLKKDVDFYSVVSATEKKFVEKFIEHYERSVLGLADAYAAACAGKVPAKILM